jgi:ABC-type uncharacterized transport system substrate-binding protein
LRELVPDLRRVLFPYDPGEPNARTWRDTERPRVIWVEQDGLASYSANPYHVGRHAARLVDRIIRGARPADIPVERATRFDLVITSRPPRPWA